jgi:hypothetical protein
MASTYSNLKIQLMATGENSGTWGNVTNDNLGVALEEAIVGSEDVTFASGNVTLTLTNTNASQTARNLRLNLIGTTGGARDLIVPAIEKIYIVNNGCADTVTIKVTGQTGVAVPAGKTMFVYNTGVDCTDAITHLRNLTLATALPITSGGTGSTSTTYANLESNVSGVLPVANGGTGSATATFSGANITSLNASSISAGTLAVARGGTGQTSYTDGQLLIGNSTGNTLAKSTLTAGTGINITNGSGTITIATSGGGGGLTTDIDLFDSPGTFTTPANTTKVLAYVVSGGGGGGTGVGGPESNRPGGAGGSGVLGAAFLTVTASTPYPITVGNAGNGGINPGNTLANGNAGNASSFGNLLTCNGGGGGTGSPGNVPGSAGATGTSPLSQIPAQPSPGAAAAVWSSNSAGAPGNAGPGGGGRQNGGGGGAGRVLIFY